MAGGITYGVAKTPLARVVENGVCPDDARVMPRVNEATKACLDELIPVGGMATYDVVAVGTTLLLPKELENAIEVQVLNGAAVRGQTDITQGFYDLINNFTYVDPSMVHDNPLVDLGLVADSDPTILRRKYDFPGLTPNATVRVTGAKRFLPITGDDDYLIVQNLWALKLMIMAIERLENGNLNEWGTMHKASIDLLTAEVKKHQLDPRNSQRHRAAYEDDMVNYPEGSFGYVRARLADTVPGAYNQGKSDLTRLIEMAEQRLMDKGHWVGTLEQFRAHVYAGEILFPTRVKTVLAADLCGRPLDLRSLFYQYQENGPGMECLCSQMLIDQGEVYFKETGYRRRSYKLTGSSEQALGTSASTTTPNASNRTLTVTDAFYIGTSARFVPVTDGVALETKNPSTGEWDRQWTQTDG